MLLIKSSLPFLLIVEIYKLAKLGRSKTPIALIQSKGCLRVMIGFQTLLWKAYVRNKYDPFPTVAREEYKMRLQVGF
jgi:hypothetical protein